MQTTVIIAEIAALIKMKMKCLIKAKTNSIKRRNSMNQNQGDDDS
jgi:hypothetical protein